MQAWTIMTAIALVAAIPMATAADPEGCDEQMPREETLVHPLDSSAYIVLTDTDTLGFWRETNGHAGLQTQDCVADIDGFVDTLYFADERVNGVVLA